MFHRPGESQAVTASWGTARGREDGSCDPKADVGLPDMHHLRILDTVSQSCAPRSVSALLTNP